MALSRSDLMNPTNAAALSLPTRIRPPFRYQLNEVFAPYEATSTANHSPFLNCENVGRPYFAVIARTSRAATPDEPEDEETKNSDTSPRPFQTCPRLHVIGKNAGKCGPRSDPPARRTRPQPVQSQPLAPGSHLAAPRGWPPC